MADLPPPSSNPTPEAVRRFEHCEARALEDLYAAADPETAKAAGIEAHRAGKILVLTVASCDVLALNRVVGVGLDRPISRDQVTRFIRFFAEREVPRFFVQVPPGPHQAATRSLLEDLGFRHYNNWVRLYRGLDDLPHFAGEAEVEEVRRADAALFGAIVAEAFGWPAAMAETVARTAGRKGWADYLARLDGKIAATGAFYSCGDLIWLSLAATRTAFRGRGAQKQLVVHRLAEAKRRGHRGVAVETAEPTSEKPAPSHANLRRLGFVEVYRRPNYVWEVR